MNHKIGQKLANQLRWWLVAQSETVCKVQLLMRWQCGQFMNSLGDAIACILNRLEVNTKLGEETGTPQELGWNYMRWKHNWCESLYLEQSHPKQQYRLGSGCVVHLESSVVSTFQATLVILCPNLISVLQGRDDKKARPQWKATMLFKGWAM